MIFKPKKTIPRVASASLIFGSFGCGGSDSVSTELKIREACDFFQACDAVEFSAQYGSVDQCVQEAQEIIDFAASNSSACGDAVDTRVRCEADLATNSCNPDADAIAQACRDENREVLEACADLESDSIRADMLAYCEAYQLCYSEYFDWDSLDECADYLTDYMAYLSIDYSAQCVEAYSEYLGCIGADEVQNACSYDTYACLDEYNVLAAACPEGF